jgi:hypothetical protein
VKPSNFGFVARIITHRVANGIANITEDAALEFIGGTDWI